MPETAPRFDRESGPLRRMTTPPSRREPVSDAEAVLAAKAKIELDRSRGRETDQWIVDIADGKVRKDPAGGAARRTEAAWIVATALRKSWHVPLPDLQLPPLPNLGVQVTLEEEGSSATER